MRAILFAVTLALALGQTTSPAARVLIQRPPERGLDVIYVATPTETVEAMLRLGEVGPGDVLYDLGSGDGRIPIAAARQFGIRAVGIDIDANRVREAKANARAAGVDRLVRFRRQDLFRADFREATVVTLYLLPELNERLMPKMLRELKPGTRIVSHAFPMGEWAPEQTKTMADGGVIYRWTVPARAEGRP